MRVPAPRSGLIRLLTGTISVLALAVPIAAASLLTATPAEARGFVGVSVGIGLPVFAPGYYGPGYYAPGYYRYPPGYYAYPPAYYAAPPVVYAPAPVTSPAYSTSNCRDFQSTEMIGGTAQKLVGTACQQPDGTWRIVK